MKTIIHLFLQLLMTSLIGLVAVILWTDSPEWNLNRLSLFSLIISLVALQLPPTMTTWTAFVIGIVGETLGTLPLGTFFVATSAGGLFAVNLAQNERVPKLWRGLIITCTVFLVMQSACYFASTVENSSTAFTSPISPNFGFLLLQTGFAWLLLSILAAGSLSLLQKPATDPLEREF